MYEIYLKELQIHNINKNYLSWFTKDLKYIEYSRNRINLSTLRLYFLIKLIEVKKNLFF